MMKSGRDGGWNVPANRSRNNLSKVLSLHADVPPSCRPNTLGGLIAHMDQILKMPGTLPEPFQLKKKTELVDSHFIGQGA